MEQPGAVLTLRWNWEKVLTLESRTHTGWLDLLVLERNLRGHEHTAHVGVLGAGEKVLTVRLERDLGPGVVLTLLGGG